MRNEGVPHASISFIAASSAAMPLWTTSRPSPRRAIVITRRSDMPGSAPSTRHRFSLSCSMGPCERTFQAEASLAMPLSCQKRATASAGDEDDLAARVVRLAVTMRVGDLGEGEHAVDRRLDRALLDELGDELE